MKIKFNKHIINTPITVGKETKFRRKLRGDFFYPIFFNSKTSDLYGWQIKYHIDEMMNDLVYSIALHCYYDNVHFVLGNVSNEFYSFLQERIHENKI